ncbi:hypothetical protein [Streptacidiphilus rugosus]|uniref:hypothetical protein n=1 Tax=Streptacidiphilus rugosus TaxID=405783 RepID=UPI00055B11E6|nr:hypothetical protein [Streptacidiphilus rugosus]
MGHHPLYAVFDLAAAFLLGVVALFVLARGRFAGARAAAGVYGGLGLGAVARGSSALGAPAAVVIPLAVVALGLIVVGAVRWRRVERATGVRRS